MTISVLDVQRVLTTGTGTTVTVTLNNLSGSSVVIVAACSARTVNTAFTITDVTWAGGSMGAADVSRSDNLNGFPAGISALYSVAIGNPSNATETVVMTLSTSNAMRAVTVYALGGVTQSAFVHDTATQGTITGATNTSISLNTSQATDLTLSVVTCASQLTGTPGAGQTPSQEATTDPVTGTHMASYVLPGNEPSQNMTWSWGSSSFVHAGATYIDAGVVPPAIALLDEDTVVGTGTNGDPVTVSLGPLTGSDVCIILCASGNKEANKIAPTTATWDGNPMDPAVLAAGNANFNTGDQLGEIWVLPIGDVSGLTADVVWTLSATDPTGAGRICYAAAYTGINQGGAVFDTAKFEEGSFSSGTTVSTTVNVPDDSLVISCMGANEAVAPMTFDNGPGETVHANLNNGVGNGTDCAIAVATLNPGATPTQTMGWTWGIGAVRAHAVASFNIADPITITETISSKGTNAIINVTDTDITVNGTGMQGTGDTVVVYADSTNYTTATKVVQLTSSVTATSVNWDEPNLGTIGRGMHYIFVVKNFGLGSESRSDAFAVQVEAFTDAKNIVKRVYTTDGTTGNVIVVDNTPFVPKAAIIQWVGTNDTNSLVAPAHLGMCFVATNNSGGIDIVSSTSPSINRRRQALGSGSLIIMSESSSSGTDQVTGTPTLTSNGLDINFTNNTAGKTLYITFFGGIGVEATLSQFAISDGSVSGLTHQPDLVFGLSNCASTANDTSFAVISFGIATAGAAQCGTSANYSGTSRNASCTDAHFLAQVASGGTTYDWEMVITSINSDGYSWTGSNADLGYGLAITFGGPQVNLLQFDTDASGVQGFTENLPDLGFDPGYIGIATATRVGTSIASALGARWSYGSCLPNLNQNSTYSHHLPATGTGTARQQRANTLVAMGSALTTSLEFQAKISVFGQVSTIEYVSKPAASLRLCVLGIETGDEIAGDTDGAAVMTSFHGEDIVP